MTHATSVPRANGFVLVAKGRLIRRQRITRHYGVFEGNRRGQVYLLRFCAAAMHLCEEAVWFRC